MEQNDEISRRTDKLQAVKEAANEELRLGLMC